MNHLRVDVSAEDIRNGKRNRPTMCPIALGFKRANPLARWVVVYGDHIIWGANNRNWKWKPHTHVHKFMAHFDAGDCVKPLTFFIRKGAVKPADWNHQAYSHYEEV